MPSTAATPLVAARPYTQAAIKNDPVSDEMNHKTDYKSTKTNVKTIKDSYTEPMSNREEWWRSQLRETPVPGKYEINDFLQEEAKRPTQHSYNFRSEGRKREINQFGRGEMLLPGEFNRPDFLEELAKRPVTYGFKSKGRFTRDFTTKDKDVNVSPDKYPIERYFSLTVEKTPSKHMVFRSQVQRCLYRPNDVPPPGKYDLPSTNSAQPINFVFRSKTPRFRTAHTKVPGPGVYEKTYQTPMPPTLAKMGRQHGLFFQTAFNV